MNFLSLKNISKSFYGVQVLKNVSFEVHKAEIHGLIGENGAGKSTLMNITSGMLAHDDGQVIVEEKVCSFSHPVEAEKEGIVHIHQELNILPNLTVVENLFLGREIHKNGVLQEAKMRKKAQEIFIRLGLKLDISIKAGNLSMGHQQMIEIAKSLLHNNVKLIILDEPTSSLANHEIEKLFEIINFLKKNEHVSFIYVSHRMQELFHICNRVTILRDGEYIGTRVVKNTSLDEIIPLMIGRNIQEQYGTHPAIDSALYNVAPVLQVKDMSKGTMFNNVNFALYRGEILGFYGLVGAGRTDVVNAIFGSNKATSGEIFLDANRYSNNTPSSSIKKGIGLLSENRKEEGILDNFSVQSNISISNLEKISRWGIISDTKENQIVQELITKLSVKVSNAKNSILSLSGGNQQKSLLCRCFTYPLKVLLLDEPTRGIDVGSKHDIYQVMRLLAQNGVGLIMVSSDLPEIMGVADRIAIMHEGTLIKILTRNEADEETIMYLSTNTHKKSNENIKELQYEK